MNINQKVYDVFLRSVKTFFAAFVATIAAGGLNVATLSTTKQLILSALAAGATAVLNAGIQVHNTITSPATPATTPAPVSTQSSNQPTQPQQ